jgi:hypothetical protein
MADNNFRRYRGQDPNSMSDTDGAAAEFARDPLAELARLIGQGDPAAELQGSRPNSAELLEHVGSESEGFERQAHEGYQDTAYYGDAGQHGQLEQYHQSAHYGEEPYAEAPSVDSYPSVPDYDAGYETYEAAAELPAIAAPPPLPALPPQDPDDEYAAEEQWQDYADEQSDAAEDYDYASPNSRGRTIAVMALSLVGLMVVGSATAFAYRAMFGGKLLPSMPPIIMASGGPNKIAPPPQTASASQSGAATPGGAEQLVSREEQPVQVQPTNPPPPRVVSTVPVMPATSTFPPVPPPPVPQVGNPFAPSLASTPARPASPGMAPEPKKVHTVSIPVEPAGAPGARARSATAALARPMAGPATRPSADGPLSLVPTGERNGATREASHNQVARADSGAPLATESIGSRSGGYTVQLTSQRTEAEAQAAYRSLRSKFPQELGGHEPIIRRADLGAKGTYYRAMVGPFGSAEAAAEVCSKLKAAGGSCIVQRN